MRLDHYKKIGKNNIHVANILYNFAIIVVLVLMISTMLGKTLTKDLANIKLFNLKKSYKSK